MQKRALLSLVLVLPLLVGCEAMVGKAGSVKIPPDAADQCAHHCQSIGMRLSAVAIMANNVGCVCEVAESTARTRADSTANTADSAGATTGGMATLQMLAEERREEEQAQTSRQY